MKSAQEMFEDIGFMEGYHFKDFISYRLFCDHELMVEVSFLVPDKRYYITKNKNYFDNSHMFFEPEIHKAIHKQLEELGWLE